MIEIHYTIWIRDAKGFIKVKEYRNPVEQQKAEYPREPETKRERLSLQNTMQDGQI